MCVSETNSKTDVYRPHHSSCRRATIMALWQPFTCFSKSEHGGDDVDLVYSTRSGRSPQGINPRSKEGIFEVTKLHPIRSGSSHNDCMRTFGSLLASIRVAFIMVLISRL